MELWSIGQTAKQTGTSEAFWRKEVLLRHITVIKVGRLVRLRPEDVTRYLEARIRPAQKVGK